MNLKFTISYDGTKYFGSQKQPNKNTVEDEILKAFKQININTKVILSGRTDKDVHATGQVFNAKIPEHFSDFSKLKTILNKTLPNSIKIEKICKVDDSFHARFSAKRRVYRYLITQKQTNVFNDNYITYVKNIDENILKLAIKEFVGVHNFKYFHKTGSDKENLNREIFSANFYKYKDIYVFKFCANSYLRTQIRLMVGFLLAINNKKLTIKDLKEQLACKKHIYKTPAISNGLYLARVLY